MGAEWGEGAGGWGFIWDRGGQLLCEGSVS
jgi:hypothetical protein